MKNLFVLGIVAVLSTISLSNADAGVISRLRNKQCCTQTVQCCQPQTVVDCCTQPRRPIKDLLNRIQNRRCAVPTCCVTTVAVATPTPTVAPSVVDTPAPITVPAPVEPAVAVPTIVAPDPQ